jgi:Lipopolysaccharide-assembly
VGRETLPLLCQGKPSTLHIASSPGSCSFFVIALSICAFFFLPSCIYSFKSSGGALVESISIEQLVNGTNQSGIADRITELVVEAMIADGTIEVVSSSTAEAILSGSLTGYSRRPNAFDESDQVSEYVVTLTVELTLRKRESDQEIWKETFKHEGTYDAATQTEEDGQTRATDLIVVEILNKTTRSNW